MIPLTTSGEVPPRTTDNLALYAEMLRVRRVEEAIADSYRRQEMRCPVHLSIGQEAIAVGVCAALAEGDRVVSNHRCHAHYLARGGDLNAMLAEIHGKAAGCCGGRGGSMHLFDGNIGFMMSMPIVASSIPAGVGMALAIKQQRSDAVVAIFFGDAAVEEGVFHESANFAALQALPVLFICENNLFSVYTHLRDRQPERPLTLLAEAHQLTAAIADGNDVGTVADLATTAVACARAGAGPSFLQFDTYRHLEHCGPDDDDHLGYRDAAELAAWKDRCPIERARARLIDEGRLTAADEQALIATIDEEIAAAFRFAREAPFPEAGTAAANIYG